MNTENFVTYEQALALKKLGFKEKCFYHYDVSGIIHNNDVICNEVFQCVISSQLLGSHNSGIPKETCDAPILAQVQKWLIIKINHYVYAKPNYDKTWSYIIMEIGEVGEIRDTNTYKSCEEALSAGITKCLKILEKNNR